MRRPLIALGTRGTLDDTAWEVVGYQERTDERGRVEPNTCCSTRTRAMPSWPTTVAASASAGCSTTLPDATGVGLTHDGRSFERFGETYPVRTTFVVGEFYWRVASARRSNETDYVTPGTMLACEETGSERTWTRLDMLDWGVAERAFGIEPRRARIQRHPRAARALALSHRDARRVDDRRARARRLHRHRDRHRRLAPRRWSRSCTVPARRRHQTPVLGPITVTGAREKVKIDGRAGDLDNQWVDLDYSLVNRATQASYDAYGTAEYYRGRDSDGAWSEGDRAPDTRTRRASPRAPTTWSWKRRASLDRSRAPVRRSLIHRHLRRRAAGAPATGGATVPVTITVDRGGGFAGPFLLGAAGDPDLADHRLAPAHELREAPLAPVTATSDDDEEERRLMSRSGLIFALFCLGVVGALLSSRPATAIRRSPAAARAGRFFYGGRSTAARTTNRGNDMLTTTLAAAMTRHHRCCLTTYCSRLVYPARHVVSWSASGCGTRSTPADLWGEICRGNQARRDPRGRRSRSRWR